MRNYTELSVWQKSHLLTLNIYQLTKSFPASEFYGLVSQMRRSSSSIPTNIVEGCGRNSNADFKRFLVIASGSAAELDYQLLLSKDLSYMSLPDFETLNLQVVEIRKMLFSFITKLSPIPNT